MKLSRLKQEIKIKYYILKRRNVNEYYVTYGLTTNNINIAKKFNSHIEVVHEKIVKELSKYEIISIK